MKKIAYQTPEVKVKTLFMESLMQASGVKGGGDINIDYGGVDDEGKKESALLTSCLHPTPHRREGSKKGGTESKTEIVAEAMNYNRKPCFTSKQGLLFV